VTIRYADLGTDLQLNQIVMAGSHDAGINSGLWHVKTQSKNIGEQAAAGVRIFDLRIAAENTATFGGGDSVKLKAYHGVGKKTEQVRTVKDLGSFGTVKEMKMTVPGLSGSFGDGLSKMLGQAKSFVISNPSEFLILKFDKCTNWLAIAKSCVRELGDGNFNSCHPPIVARPDHRGSQFARKPRFS